MSQCTPTLPATPPPGIDLVQEISDTVGCKSTHVTEIVCRHVIVPTIQGGSTVTGSVFMTTEAIKTCRR